MLLLRVLFLVSFVLLKPIHADDVEFKQDAFSFDADVGTSLEIHLPDLLSIPGSANRVFGVGAGKPGWLELDTDNERLIGTPEDGDVGESNFTLFVQDGEDGANTRLTINVRSIPVWQDDPIDFGVHDEDKTFEFDLNTQVEDPAGGALTFSGENLPQWMSVSEQGIVSGTPRREHIGEYDGLRFTASSSTGSSEVSAQGFVRKIIDEPTWNANPITLPEAKEGEEYSQDVSVFVNNPEGTPLSFTLISPSDWLTISATGTLFGTPEREHTGSASVLIQFSTTIDGRLFRKTTEFKFNVEPTNHPPEWSNNPINLPDAFTAKSYSQNLAGSISDPDPGDTFKVSVVLGPSWLTFSENGAVSGTPSNADVGENRWVVRVTDAGGLSDTTAVVVNVIKSNEPPFWKADPTVLTPNAQEDFAYSKDLSPFVQDPDGDEVEFLLLDGPDWAQVTKQGLFFGTPGASHVGVGRFRIRITDNISGSDVGDVLIEVEHTNHDPYWVMNPIIFQVDEGKALSLSIAPYAKDDDPNDTLTFSALSGPSWAQLSASGTFTGTPKMEHVGENEYRVRVSDNNGATADATVIIKVLHVNHKPFWTQNPVLLPNAKERSLYSQSLSDFAKDPDPGDVLSFSKISGPDWISVGVSGSVSGTPKRSDLGQNSFRVRVMDRDHEFAEVEVKVTVDKVNFAPRWRQDPILLDDAYEDTAYEFDLSIYATDGDNDPLTFEKVDGPDWATVSSDGKLSGTPTTADVGEFSLTLRVSDGQETDEAQATGRVFDINHPPSVPDNLELKVKEREILQEDLRNHVTDKDGDTLRFVLVNPPSWLTLTQQGLLTAKPRYEHIGEHRVGLRADDSELYDEGVLTIIVERNPRAPEWLKDPIAFEARTNEPFQATLAGLAVDKDGIDIRFSKVDGPDWLTVASDGTLSGKPTDAHMGENTFTVSAANDELAADATLIITVKPGTQIDTVVSDAVVPGARAENLWIVDSSQFSYQLSSNLKGCIHHYYNALEKAQIKHQGIFLSSDKDRFDGAPISENNILLDSDYEHLIWDFQRRVDLAYTYNCFSTPIWSMFRYHDRLPNLTDIYQKKFFLKDVPMDAMIVTTQKDHYRRYTSATPQANWGVKEFATEFKRLHHAQGKPYRVSAIAPECPRLHDYSGSSSGASYENAYRILVGETQGSYYGSSCTYDIPKILRDYASKVIRRAYVFAKRKISLSKVPIEIDSIIVKLGDQVLTGNSGQSSDQWRYNSTINEVELFWYNIDITDLAEGALIAVEYRVS